MDSQLTERQEDIIHALIQEYVESAESVGSERLVEKYGFEFSPATMRNEMVELADKGFLEKDHVSAGRIPTPLAFRFYIKNMMEEKPLPVVNEVAIKQRLWDHRHDIDKLLHEASNTLSEELHNLSVVTTHDGRVYKSGAAHILRHPEFYDIDLTRTVLYLLDQYEMLDSMISQISSESEFGILLGEEIGMPSLKECGMVIGRIDLPQGGYGHMSIIGPYRLNYKSVIPTIRYLQKLINDMSRSW